MRAQPLYHSPARCRTLILDGFCQNNLAVFLHDLPKTPHWYDLPRL